MKKVITSLMLVCILFISSTITTKAVVWIGDLLPPSSIFEGSGYYEVYDEELEATVFKEGSAYAVTDADSNVILDITMDGTTTQYVLYPIEKSNGYYYCNGETLSIFVKNADGSYLFSFDSYGIPFDYYDTPLIMTSTADFTGTKIISNTTMSSTGEYMVVVGGSISGTFEAGRHQVTNATSQPLSIFIVNQTNGATRLMSATTINNMYVTVSGGQITKIEINGRAQTTPGNFDTYSIVI